MLLKLCLGEKGHDVRLLSRLMLKLTASSGFVRSNNSHSILTGLPHFLISRYNLTSAYARLCFLYDV